MNVAALLAAFYLTQRRLSGTVTPYVSILVYLTVILRLFVQNRFLDNFMSILFSITWAMGVTGIVINAFYAEKLMKKFKITQEMKTVGDIFGHLIPPVLITLFGPTQTQIPFMLIVALALALPIICYQYLVSVYIGVPPFILIGLPAVVFVLSFYLRYEKKRTLRT